MALTVDKTASGHEYKVKDMSQADIGRLKIGLAEVRMPGLMACRTEFGPSQPLKGARITGNLDVTIESAVLIETLVALGAEVRWCSANNFSTEDHVAAAIARDSAAVFAWYGLTAEEYWWCTERALDWGPGGGPDMIVDDNCNATVFIYLSVMAELELERTGKIPDIIPTDSAEHQNLQKIRRSSLKTDPRKYIKLRERLVGATEATTAGVKTLYEIQEKSSLPLTVININDSVTMSMYGKLYGRHSLRDGLMRTIDVMIAGKFVVVCGYGNVGKGCAAALKRAGARVVVTEIDPICALDALMEGFQVGVLEEVISEADIFVTATGNKGIIRVEHMRMMKNNAIVCNMGSEGEIDTLGLQYFPGVELVIPRKDCGFRYVFPDTKLSIIVLTSGLPMDVGCVIRHPGFLVSCSFTTQVITLLELWNERATGKYENKVYVLPKELDEKVAAIHIAKLGAKLTKLSKEQADYIRVPVEGPYKPSNYKY